MNIGEERAQQTVRECSNVGVKFITHRYYYRSTVVEWKNKRFLLTPKHWDNNNGYMVEEIQGNLLASNQLARELETMIEGRPNQRKDDV